MTITRQFLDHRERVNAALPAPLTLDTFTLAPLQTAYTKIKAVKSSDFRA